jgi:hypothetical protein
LFSSGSGVAQSYEEAVRWWRLAAAQGVAEALYKLGGCYEDSLGPEDLDEALRFYKRAAAKGHAAAAVDAKELGKWLAAHSGRPN